MTSRWPVLAAAVLVLAPSTAARSQLRPDPEALAQAPAELLDRLRADPFTYFRFTNRAWTTRVCEAFATTPDIPVVRLHGDAHLEQFAVTSDAWGLDDFDDSARGAMVVDVVRFLGSLDLAGRQRGWTARRDATRTRFFDGLRRGLTDPDYRPPEPAIVGVIRRATPQTRARFLAWGERLMRPMAPDKMAAVVRGMGAFEGFMRREGRPFGPGYFTVVRAGWLRMGIGSSAARKVLIRVQGPTADPADDELLEAKEVANLDGIPCLEDSPRPPALRIVNGTRQLGRLKHEILAIGPTLLIPSAADRDEHWLEWWVTSWEPSYRELRIADLRNAEDLAAIAFDSGAQLAAGARPDAAERAQALAALARLEPQLRVTASLLVDELLAGWRELSGRRAASEAVR
jgi:hypothetical protein